MNRQISTMLEKDHDSNPLTVRQWPFLFVIREMQHSKRSLDRLRLNKQYSFIFKYNVINQTHAVSVPRRGPFINAGAARDAIVCPLKVGLIVILSDSNMADTRW